MTSGGGRLVSARTIIRFVKEHSGCTRVSGSRGNKKPRSDHAPAGVFVSGRRMADVSSADLPTDVREPYVMNTPSRGRVSEGSHGSRPPSAYVRATRRRSRRVPFRGIDNVSDTFALSVQGVRLRPFLRGRWSLLIVRGMSNGGPCAGTGLKRYAITDWKRSPNHILGGRPSCGAAKPPSNLLRRDATPLRFRSTSECSLLVEMLRLSVRRTGRRSARPLRAAASTPSGSGRSRGRPRGLR